MARSASLFNGTTAGKVGEVVFFRAKGQQRARQYVGQINDRKSESQVTQRVMLAPCVSAYRLFKSVVTDSFPGAPMSQSGYNAFVSANKTGAPAYFTKMQASGTLYSFAPYQVSKGSLTPLPIPEFVGNTSIQWTMPNGSGTGFEAFKADFLAAYSDATALARFVYLRIYNNDDGTGEHVRSLSWGLSDLAFPAGVAYTAGKLIVTAPAGVLSSPFAACTIRSQRDANGKLNVSTQIMSNDAAADASYSSNYLNPDALAAAIASYGVNAAGVV